MLPRVIKAVIWGLLWFVFLYALPMLLISILSRIAPTLFERYGLYLDVFIITILFFVVASELTAGTIFQHALNIGKALILMMFIVYALSGGIVAIDLENIHVVADLRIYLLMLLMIDFLGLAKDVLQAINFLSERTEKQRSTPSPS